MGRRMRDDDEIGLHFILNLCGIMKWYHLSWNEAIPIEK